MEEKPEGLRLGYLCYGCGICTSSCPIARTNPLYDPREIIRRLVLGEKGLLEDPVLWLCSMCYTCQERCPQGIHIADLITLLRNISCGQGQLPHAVKVQLKAIKGSGKTYPLDEFDMKKREKAGLPRLKEKIPEIEELLGGLP